MEIKSAGLKFNGVLSTRKSTSGIILHHAAASSCTVKDIHGWHLGNGRAGFGYHFFVSKKGEIIRGRPVEKLGAHAGDNNFDSIGICFEGNFENEKMSDVQLKSARELVSFLMDKYGRLKIQRHKDVNKTDCPGKNFPIKEFISIPSQPPLLKKGSRGTEVRKLQELLNQNGANLKVDGFFGKLTAAAVRKYQKIKGLKLIDGIASRETRGALMK